MKLTSALVAVFLSGASITAVARVAAAAATVTNHAIAVLHPGTNGKVRGTIHFRKQPSGVRIQGTITGLATGDRGFHVHEFGDCTAPDFSSAGEHFNPTGEPHGAPTNPRRHVGDLGNVKAGADGTATVDYTDRRLAFEGARSILGRGVIVHEKADDFKTQPTGDAGGRLACGVIGVAKPE